MRAALACLLLLGCNVDLGPCDDTRARQLVYDDSGGPAYEGQALLIASCGFGAFCHSEGVDSLNRHGAPLGLDFDLRLIGAEGATDTTASAARLHRDALRAYAQRDLIWATVSSGRMPVEGQAGSVLAAAPSYVRFEPGTDNATPIAGLDAPGGREALRNWLACASPLVTSTDRINDASFGDVVDPREIAPLTASWSDIYQRLVSRRCASAPCHGATAEADLRLDDPATALSNMVGVVSQSQHCGVAGLSIIEPGNPDASLFINKLEGHLSDGSQVCGDFMPVGGSRVSAASLAAIRAWIMAGAQND